MAKKIKQHKGYIIKETGPKDNTSYKYWVYSPDDHTFVDWECDNLQEAIDFIDYREALK